MEGEWDITEEIYNTHKNNKIEATFGKVKGHRDRKERYEDLPLDAQCNVDADWYAGEFQKNQGKRIPLALQYPSYSAYLIIRNETITSNYRKQLINAYVEPMFMEYIQKKNDWEDNTIQDIAWKSLSLAAQQIHNPVLLTKVCNDILPTASTLQKWNYQETDECVLCHQHEDRDHLIRCNGTSRLLWRIKFIVALRKTLIKKKTHWQLSDMICTSLTEWMDEGYVDIRNYHEDFHLAITAQNKIGWRNFFAGKISQQWLNLHDLLSNNKSKHSQSYVWGASIMEMTLRLMIDLWNL